MKPSLRMIIGLGNPGTEYQNTYHNVGLLALLHLAKINEATVATHHKDTFFYGKGNGLIFVAPLGFMNESGIAVQGAAKKFHMKPEEILVLHDDSDIALGSYKLSFGRGSAGHRGIESVMGALGTPQFSRIRIGVRSDRHKGKAGDFVLKQVTKADLKTLYGVFGRINENVIVKATLPPSE